MEEMEADPEAALARMDALVSQMTELEQAANITEEASPDPGSTGSTTPQVPSINMNIFGKYTCVATGGVNNETINVYHHSAGYWRRLIVLDRRGWGGDNKETNIILHRICRYRAG
jgi:hypothetical protein